MVVSKHFWNEFLRVPRGLEQPAAAFALAESARAPSSWPPPNPPQTLLGERLLALQLSAMGVLPKRTASLADAPEAQEALRALWKAQGDAISRGYTGTAALRKKRWLRDAAISLGRRATPLQLCGASNRRVQLCVRFLNNE